MTFYFLFVFGTYFLMMVVLRIGWEWGIRPKKTASAETNFFISVVVAIRNEESTVENLMTNLSGQNYPSSDFEVILVDDHSNDRSNHFVKTLSKDFSNFRIISLNETEIGKKAALAKGIALAKGKIIATTDADCTLPSDWLKNINSEFYIDKVKMVVGLVSISSTKDFFSRLQAMEFASVMGTSVATINLGLPTMCNGANLSFWKQAFEEVNGYSGNENIASGDDEFLMRKILRRYPGSVHVLNDPSAMVVTQPLSFVSDFIHQRLRWASKWKYNSSFAPKALAVFIFAVQVSWIVFIISFFFGTSSLAIFVILVWLKIIADLFFLVPVFRFLAIKFRLIPFVALQFLYPFYVVFISIFSPWKRNRWKGRPIT